MTKKRFNFILQSTLHSLVFLSLCLAPLLHNVLNNLQNETAVETAIKASDVLRSDALVQDDAEDASQVGLSNTLKNFWSLTRSSQRYFSQRKNSSSFSLYSKTFQNTIQSVVITDQKLFLSYLLLFQ